MRAVAKPGNEPNSKGMIIEYRHVRPGGFPNSHGMPTGGIQVTANGFFGTRCVRPFTPGRTWMFLGIYSAI